MQMRGCANARWHSCSIHMSNMVPKLRLGPLVLDQSNIRRTNIWVLDAGSDEYGRIVMVPGGGF
jgi:hypothetical protein